MTNWNDGSAVRVAIYARVSSEQQHAKAATIESQVQALVDRAAQDGHELEEEFRFIDAGYSHWSLHKSASLRGRVV